MSDTPSEAWELLDALASLEHEQWSHWTTYMLDYLIENDEPDCDAACVRWRHQAETPYQALSEKTKASDREWAARVTSVIRSKGWVLLSPNEFQRVIRAIVATDVQRIILQPKDISEWDRLVYGTSFELGGARVDPRHVVLKDDGTYEINNDS